MRRSSILLCIIASLCLAGSAGAQSALGAVSSTSPSLNNYLESEPEANSATAEAEAEEAANAHAKSSSSSGPSTLLIAGVAAAVLLFGIAFLIVRDARKVAPVVEGPSGGVSAEVRAAAIRQRRTKAKAARRQRKRNR